jgi:hypothetical protein
VANRKTPAEQIEAARQMLARAQQRQRAADTRSKIVLGGLLISWLRDDERVRRALLNRINEKPLREQDLEVLVDFLNELRDSMPAAQQQPMVQQ